MASRVVQNNYIYIYIYTPRSTYLYNFVKHYKGELIPSIHQRKLMEPEILKAFHDTKGGVKGLVDAGGMVKIPDFFHLPIEERVSINNSNSNNTHLKIPVVDLRDIDKDENRRKVAVEEVLRASGTWGFFQLVNHGIPLSVLDEMIEGTRRFFEQDTEVKKGYYTLDPTKKVGYSSNLYKGRSANWRDTLYLSLAPEPPQPQELPQVCREIIIEYEEHVSKLGERLLELISEALGLKADHLKNMDVSKGHTLVCHYYPACPEPELTIGGERHTDSSFLTILLQDQIGGLQVLHKKQWVDVHPVPGALVVNIGDLLQLISNDKLKSVEHRILVNGEKTRVSAGFFLGVKSYSFTKRYGPIKELLSDENPPIYRDTLVSDFVAYLRTEGYQGNTNLAYLRI